jgi:two-component system, NarL family, sensor kinase
MHATITELEILRDVAEALNRTSDLDDAMGVVLERVSARFGLPTGWIWLLDASGEAWVAAARNLPPALADDPRALLGNCWCLDSFRNGKLSSSTNVTAVHCTRLKDLVQGTAGLEYHQSVPVRGDGGERVGLLNVASPDWRELSEDELRILVTIGDMLGLAVQRAQNAEEASQLAAVQERNRIAREIHDTIAQSLVGAALQLESAEANLEVEGRQDRAQKAVGRALELVRSSLEDARRSVLNLRAAPLEGLGLCEALLALADDDVDVSATGVGTLAPRVELGVYRVAQEAVHNARAHAEATRVHVELVRAGSELTLTVEDDGAGFDAGAVAPERFGLVGMRERAHLLGGTLDLRSAPGRGTRVTLCVPVGETR